MNLNTTTYCKKSHVLFLLISFLIVNQFFNTFLVDIHVYRIINWTYSVLLTLYVFYLYLKGDLKRSWIKQWRVISWFLLIVSLSFIYVGLSTNQTFSETLRVSITWYQYLLVFLLAKKKFTQKEIFISVTIFSFIWFLAWIAGFLSPVPLFDASGEYSSDLLSTSRGVVRLKVTGEDLMYLWGFWCLSIYTSNKKKKYLLAYFVCLLFVILCVSRQHILYYSLVGIIYLFHKFSIFKKAILAASIIAVVELVIPNTTIFQNLTDLTESQMYANDGGKDDVRIQAINYFVTEYPQNAYTFLLGHGAYHSNSNYGIKMFRITDLYGYVLADIGYVSIFFFYGLFGILCFVKLFKIVYSAKLPENIMGIKLFIYFTYLGNIFSHNIDASIVSTALCMYLIYINMFNAVRLRK